jgi:hypothetical protein
MTISIEPEVTTRAQPADRRGWLAWLAIVLLVGLGAGFLVGRVTKADTKLPSDLAGTTITKMLDGYTGAANAGDATKIASFFATDATFTDTNRVDGYVLEGNTKIAETMASWHAQGWRLTETGTAVQNGDLVARYENGGGVGVVLVFQMKDGKFQNVWAVRP